MRKFDQEAHAVIQQSIWRVLKREPFLAHIALGVKWRQDYALSTPFATDGTVISYNPELIPAIPSTAQKMTDKEIAGQEAGGRILRQANKTMIKRQIMQNADTKLDWGLASACTQIALRHPYRAMEASMDRMDVKDAASEIATTPLIKNIFNQPNSLLDGTFAGRFYSDCINKRLTFEGSYRFISSKVKKPPPEKSPPEKGEGGGGAPSSLQRPGDGSDPGSEKSEKTNAYGQPYNQPGGDPHEDEGGHEDEGSGGTDEAASAEIVDNALSAAKMAGKQPGSELRRALELIGQGQKDWRDQLRKWLAGGEVPSQSWDRPNRRYIAEDIYLPGMPKEGPGVVVLAIDTSGSINDSLLAKFLVEIRKVNDDLKPEKIHVVCCDCRVQWTAEYGPYDQIEAQPKGRGGTAFSPVFKWVAEQGINAKALIYFTDLYCSDYGPKPNYPVLWVQWPEDRDSGVAQRVPWGEVISMGNEQ